MKKFTEFGIDFDNNKFGLGISSELEDDFGNETRKSGFVKMKPKAIYARFWIFNTVFAISTATKPNIRKKNRNNFKLVIGIAGV